MKITSLNGLWELHDEPLDAPRITDLAHNWIIQPVPGDIHQGLIRAGRINDPLLGMNSFDCAWTEERSWWFRKRFDTDPAWLHSKAVELELNGLDSNASIYLNGAHLGDHHSAFYPFIADIKKFISPDAENTLLIRLTSGIENVTPEQLATLGVPVGTEAGNGRPERGDPRRAFVRKPQYSFGWDWSPRVATTAIGGDVTIRAWNTVCIRDVLVRPVQNGDSYDDIRLHITVTVDVWHYFSTANGALTVTVIDEKGGQVTATHAGLLRSGLNHITCILPLATARLWWPNGMGDQHLYTVQAALNAQGSWLGAVPERASWPAFKYGLRFVELDTGDAQEARFAFVINGKRIFSKGADWIPADTLYARTGAERYMRLVDEAKQANFNMLRVWGGGLYEPEMFYTACDRAGMTFLAQHLDDEGEIALGSGRDHIGRARAGIAHAHIERTVVAEGEAALGLVDLHGGNAEIADHAVHQRVAVRLHHVLEIGETLPQENEPAAGRLNQVGAAGDRVSIPIEGEHAGIGRRQDRAAIAAGPESRVHIDAAVVRRQKLQDRMDEHGNVTSQSASAGGDSAAAARHHSRAPSVATRELNCFLSARTFAVASASSARKRSGSQI